MGRTRITLCAGCGADDAAAASLRGVVGTGCDVVTAGCMNNCARPVTVAVATPGRAAYLFADVYPVAQAAEIAEFVRLHRAAPDGRPADVRGCGRLRYCLIGCIPA